MKRLIVILLFAFSIQTNAQKIPDMGLYKVRITSTDKNITAEIKPVGSVPSIQASLFYNWYSSNQIKQTQGGYSGTLLNGQYNEFYLSKGLKEQGNFDTGLKDGIWKQWTEDGTLIQTVTWKDGAKDGEFDYYDENGNPKQKGSYRHGLLDGAQITYGRNGKKDSMVYKNGALLPKSEPVPFWSKINIFKKKH